MLNDTLVKGHSNDEIKKALVTLAALDKKNTDANGLLDDFLSRINHKNKVSDAPKFIANTVGFWRAAAFQFEEEAISYFGRLINERDKFENIMFSSAVLSALTFSKNDRTQEHSIRLLNKIKLKLKKYDHIYKVKREILRGEIESGIKKDHSDLNQLIKFGIESNDEIQYLSEYGWTSGIMNNLERKIHTPTIRDINLSSTYKIMWRLVDLYGKDI